LFGAGYGHFGDFTGDRAAHSSFVNCYAELGLVGYVAWFGLCWFVTRALLRIARMQNVLDSLTIRLAAGNFAALTGYLTSAFFLSRTYNPVLFLLLGMGVGLIRYVRRQPGVPLQQLEITRRDFVRAAAIAVLSVPGIWILIRLYWATGGAPA
jgi:putative inorganic carbon (HCO3(-)) transporter